MRPSRSLASCLSLGKKRQLGTVTRRKQTVPTIHRKKSSQFKPTVKSRQFAKTALLKQIKQISTNNVNTSQSRQTGPKYYANATILQNEIPMLLDSGSQVTLINSSQCPADILGKLAKPAVHVNAYNGSSIDILGWFQTDIQIGDIVLPKSPIYVTSQPYKSILGTPALKHLEMNFKTSQLRCNSNTAKMHKSGFDALPDNFNLQTSPSTPKSRKYPLFVTEVTTVPPKSEMMVPVKIHRAFDDYGLFMTEPKSCQYNIIVAKSVSQFSRQQKTAFIRVCNPSPNAVELKARQEIVDVSLVSEVSTLKTQNKRAALSEVKIGNVDPANKKKILDLLEKYNDVFATENEPLGKTDTVHFDVNTGDSPPQAQQKYRTPYFLRDELKRIIDKNVKNGLMEECSSPWAAPTLLVKKPSGAWRLVCDYRRLNEVTVSDQYPLPEITDCVNELAESKYFSTTDLFSGFHQIPTTVAARQKLAVITDFGQYTWKRMPMGAKNCPSVFQRLMDKCFRSMPLSTLVIYLDDILLHSKTLEDHIAQLDEMFSILRKNNLQIRANKTTIATDEIVFCGYKIKNGYKYPNQEKVSAVRDLRPPRCAKEAQSVFGLLNYHRSFIVDFARKAAPITKTYNAKGRFRWTPEANAALETLKKLICDAALHLKIPLLREAQFILETDASDTGYGATLFTCVKETNHNTHNASCLRPVEYMSCAFTPAQIRYYIQEKELFAGKESMKKWSHYLLGRPFQWHIDNACVKWAHRVKSTNRKISQWLAEISSFDATTVLKKSAQMKISDCLSRQFAEINAIQLSKSEIANLQENDEQLAKIRNYVTNNRWPNKCNHEELFYAKIRPTLQFGRSGELLSKTLEGVKLVVPKSIVQDLICTYHNDIGHPGYDKTLTEMANRYIWPSMQNDVKEFTQTCHQCQISKPNLKPKQPPMGQSATPNRPFSQLAFDLIGPLTVTDNDNKYVLVGIDLFTKRVYATALESKEAFQVAKEVERIIFNNPILPDSILTDNGMEFVDISQLCQRYNIRHSKSAPYHPQTNGAVERANQTLKQRLFEIDNEATWDDRLQRIVHAINCSRNAVTRCSPFELETGYPGRNFADRIDFEPTVKIDLSKIRKNALDRILAEKTARVEKFKNDSFSTFNIGDLVVTKNHVQKMPRYIGPYEVIKIRGDGLSLVLKELDGFGTLVRPVTDLKRYYARFVATPTPAPPPETDSSQHEPESSYDVFDDEDFEINFFTPPAASHTNSAAPKPNDEEEEQIDNEDEIAQIDNDDGLIQEGNDDESLSDKTNDAESVILSDPDELESPPGLSDGFSSIDEIVTDGIVTDPEEHLFSDEEIGQLNESIYESAAEQSDESEGHDVTVVQNEEPLEIPSTSSEQTHNEPLYNNQLYLQRKSGKVSPKPDVKFEMPLYQLTSKELHDLGNQFKINLTGTVFQQKQQLEEFITQTYPTHKRTQDGHLIFGCTFDPAVKKNLKEHSLVELKAIIKAYKLPSPSLLFTKKDVYKHVKKHLLKKYPNSLVNGDIVFSRSRGGSPTQ